MFRTNIVITSPTLTFSTPAEFITELENYYDEIQYETGETDYTTSGKMISRTESLDDSSTLRIVVDWDSETSYNDFYINSATSISTLEAAGYTRTVTI